jgi:tetratricopeptide (TPR) repeat protein
LIQALWNQAKGNQASARQAVLEWFARNAKVEYSQELDLSKLSPETLGFASAMFEAIEDQQGADRTFNAILDINPQIAKDYLKTLLRHDVSRLRNAGLKRLCGSLDELNLSPIDLSVMLSIISVLEFDKDKANDLVRLLAGKLEQSESEDMVALVATGDFFLAKKATKEALMCYKRIVQLEPKNPAALNNLANILIEVSPENAQEALGYIDQAVALIPDNAVLLDTKGTVLILLKRYDEAAQALSIATKKGGDPRSALHWYMALINAGKNQEANTVKQLIDKKTLRDVYLLPEDRMVLEKL